MTNLWYGQIETFGEYVDLAEITELTFVDDTPYTIEVQGVVKLYVAGASEEEPTGGGFTLTNERIQWTPKDGAKAYVSTIYKSCDINIAE